MKLSTTSTSMLAIMSSVALLSLTGSALADDNAPAPTTADGQTAPAAKAEPTPPAEAAASAEATPQTATAPTPAAQPSPQPTYGPPPGYAYPPGYGPPPGYAYPPGYAPPPAYGYRHGYGYPPPRVVPAGREMYRPFTIGLGLGMGSIGLLNKGGWGPELGMSYSLRFGFGITPRWLVTFAADGAWTNFDETSYSLVSYTAGAQFFATRWLYIRAGMGLGCSSGEDHNTDWSDCNGQTFVTAVGAEFAQTQSTSFAVEATGGFARYGEIWDPKREGWRDGEVLTHIGLNLVLNLY